MLTDDKEDIVLGRLMEETAYDDVVDTNPFLTSFVINVEIVQPLELLMASILYLLPRISSPCDSLYSIVRFSPALFLK